MLEQRGAPFDLTLIIFETGADLTASLRYNSDLFDRATIERLAGHFNNLLAGVVAAPDKPLGEIAMLAAAEHDCIVARWNATERAYPREVAFPQIFEQQAARTPDAQALHFEDQTLTYSELNARANQLARYLQRSGVRHGQTIALCLPRCPETVVAILAAWKMGAGYLFLDPVYPGKRLAAMVQDARPVVLLASDPVPELGIPIIRVAEDWSKIAEACAANLDMTVAPDDPAYIIYTSGSTGQPKGTVLRHRGVGNMLAQDAVFAPHAMDRILQFASLSFDASVFELVMTLGRGATLVMATQGTLLPGPGLRQFLRDQRVTIATLPPSVAAMLLPAELPALRILIVAGEACSADVVAAWAPGRRMFNAYGPTEATVWSTVAECKDDGKAPAIGRPIGNTPAAYVLDAHLQPVPVGVPGELYLAGPGLAVGYLNQPELTAERFLANPFSTADEGVMYRTGDLCRWRPSGELDFLGRRDQQLKLRGYRVELEEIQEVLRRHPGVADALVLVRPGEDGQPALAAFVVPRGPDQVLVAELRASLRQHLPHYMIPSSVLVLEQFPLTVNGKIDRARLLASGATQTVGSGLGEPSTHLEKLLAKVWTRVLRVDAVGSLDNFFELGGASIQTLEVVSLAAAEGLKVTPEMIFRHQSLAELAKACDHPSAQPPGEWTSGEWAANQWTCGE